MTVLFEAWTVQIAYQWQKKYNEDGNGNTYTFASRRGCEEFVKEQLAHGEVDNDFKVLWYAIQGLNHIPCDESKPWGQTYQGVIYHEFKDLRKES